MVCRKNFHYKIEEKIDENCHSMKLNNLKRDSLVKITSCTVLLQGSLRDASVRICANGLNIWTMVSLFLLANCSAAGVAITATRGLNTWVKKSAPLTSFADILRKHYLFLFSPEVNSKLLLRKCVVHEKSHKISNFSTFIWKLRKHYESNQFRKMRGFTDQQKIPKNSGITKTSEILWIKNWRPKERIFGYYAKQVLKNVYLRFPKIFDVCKKW